MSDTILPGSTLGVLGSGQLGRMFAIAARRLGYRVHVYSPHSDTPTGQVADKEFSAEYDDWDQLTAFAKSVDVVTFEFENVPAEVTNCIEQHTQVHPSGDVLKVAQHRIREKSTLAAAGLPVPVFQAVNSLDELKSGIQNLGAGVVKSASWGYDGKGQALIRSVDECETAWAKITAVGTNEAILEELVDFQCEVSVIGARNAQGEFVHYGPFLNHHENHILDVTTCPSGLGPSIENRSFEVARSVFEALNVVGVLCIEMFVTRDDQILINELAPRPHNSGHLTIDAHVTCQFEQQVRAICGLPLGSPEQHAPAAMVNLLGDLWSSGEPNWSEALKHPGAKLHLYGKKEASVGRKMGHITANADSTEAAKKIALDARLALASKPA
jgi:5-(carboxyamino)imidazole ribonucleotide synthase